MQSISCSSVNILSWIRRIGLTRVVRTIRDRRISSLELSDREISARVFDEQYLAVDCILDISSDELDWYCSCSNPEPCVHSAALLAHCFLEGIIQPSNPADLRELRRMVWGSTGTGDDKGQRLQEPDQFSFDDDSLFAAAAPGKDDARARESITGSPPAPGDLPGPGTEAEPAPSREPWTAQGLGPEPGAAQGSVTEPGAMAEPGTVGERGMQPGSQAVQHSEPGPGIEQDMQPGEALPPVELPPCPEGVEPLLRVHQNASGTGIQLFFRYGDREISFHDHETGLRGRNPDTEQEPFRNREYEQSFFRVLEAIIQPDIVFERGLYAGLFKEAPQQDIQIRSTVGDFLLHRGRVLLDAGIEVLVENRRVYRANELSLSLDRELDMLGLRMMAKTQAGPMPLAGSPEPGASGLVKSGNFSYVLLRDRDLRQLEYLKRRGMDDQGLLETSSINMVLLDRVYEQVSESQKELLRDVRERLEVLSDASKLPPAPLPERLGTSLRSYQLYGYNWLVYMLESGMNPCLADDMGLGKTLQTLTLIAHLHDGGKGPALVVSPVVTLANWEAEASRFVPGLRTYIHQGSQRLQSLEEICAYDLILVSYQTLRIDLPLFLDRDWDLLVLDEAHTVKNIQSQLFKTVRSLRARHRVSLTGTPIENSVMELFAQMDFLNPGLLGSAREFYGEFFRGIQKEGDENLLEELKELVKPFILRRTKNEVLDELPGKEIMIRYIDMGEDQKQAYDESRLRLVEELAQEDDPRERGSRMFTSLLRLRQLAVHPPLADPAYRGISSAKMEALELLMSDILSEDHKLLIFSQFLGTLDAVASLCKSRGWKHLLLSGKTRNRDSEVRRFQEDPEMKVFLLSLKAGGVGINLTAADYVILFDPWWNPAAEQQAIDRAHRMGQKRKVSAFKLIVRGSIEEKILKLQEIKSSLADEIVNNGSLLGHLSREELMDLFS